MDPSVTGAIIGAVATVAAAIIALFGVIWNRHRTSDAKAEDGPMESSPELWIDDVIVEKGNQHIRLDVRLRNAGNTTVNVTRADLHVLSRLPFAAVYAPSASYDLLLEAEHNMLPVAHALEPNEIDRFIIRVGFTPYNTSCSFTAELVLHYNGEYVTVSEPFHFDSDFG